MSMTKKDKQMKALQEQEAVANVIKTHVLSGHKRPTTRRDFLSSGLTLFGGSMFLPTLSQLISLSAWGAECGGAPTGGLPPAYINLELSGGAALFANFIARGSGGAGLDYRTMGMGRTPTAMALFANDAPFWIESDAAQNSSHMYRGMISSLPRNGADADIYSKTAFVAVAAESLDDRATNVCDISGMLSAAGIVGSSLPHLLTGYGVETISNPAINSVGAIIASANMAKVTSPANLEGSLTFKGALGTMPAGVPLNLIKTIEKLSKKQVEALKADGTTHESQKILRELAECAVEKNSQVMATTNVADIYSANFPNASAVQAIWARNKTAADFNAQIAGLGATVAVFNDVITRAGLVTANVMRGYSSAATITLGGYDYHSGYSRESADLKDRQWGDIIGRILRTAKVFNRKVFLHVTTDGSLNSVPSDSDRAQWSADYPKRTMQYIFAYDPAGAPSTQGFSNGSYVDQPYQLNHFTPDGVVSNANPIGSLDATDLAAAAVFLNYLNFAGKSALIDAAPLSKVKARLVGALPTGGGSIQNYFTRIKS